MPAPRPPVRHDDPIHGWLGASPDGLIESLSLNPPASAGAAGSGGGSSPDGDAGWQSVRPVRGAGPLMGPGRGILEIKCPYNRGQPELAVPPPHAIWYYMPQVMIEALLLDVKVSRPGWQGRWEQAGRGLEVALAHPS